MPASDKATDGDSLAAFACPNPDCDAFSQFNAGNLSVVEWIGKDKAIRRLYCTLCHGRFSERRGSLMQYTKLPQEAVVRIIKCLGYGCSIEATADICEVDPRTVAQLLERADRRAEDFHRLQIEKLDSPPAAVEMDKLLTRDSPDNLRATVIAGHRRQDYAASQGCQDGFETRTSISSCFHGATPRETPLSPAFGAGRRR